MKQHKPEHKPEHKPSEPVKAIEKPSETREAPAAAAPAAAPPKRAPKTRTIGRPTPNGHPLVVSYPNGDRLEIHVPPPGLDRAAVRKAFAERGKAK